MWSRGLFRVHCLWLSYLLLLYEGGQCQPTLSLKQEGEDIFEGDSVTFDCQANDSDTWEYLWYKDGRIFHEDWHNSRTQMMKRVTVTDKGAYRCYTRRKADKSEALYSNPVQLHVSELFSSPTLSVTPLNPVWVTEFISLQCHVHLTNKTKDTALQYRFVRNNTTLTIRDLGQHNIKWASLEDAGNYYCEVVADRNGFSKRSSAVYVQVKAGKPKPRLSVSPSWTRFYIGEAMNLTCRTEDISSGWSYSWYKDNQEASLDLVIDTTDDGAVYALRRLTGSHSGEYRCRAARGNPLFHSDFSDPLVLLISDPPMASLTIVPQQTTFDTGEAVSLYCMVEGSPDKWLYYWYKGNTTSQISQLQTRSQKGKNYTVTSAALSDSGEYWCRASREDQSSYSRFSQPVQLHVYERPAAVLSLTMGWTQMFITEAVTFECNITGKYSKWHYKWYKDRKVINSSANNQLTIGSAAESDTGSYTCQGERAENPTKSQISEARNITVSVSLPRLSLTSPETNAYEGENFTLTCEVKGGTQGWKYDFFKGSQHDVLKRDSKLNVHTIQEATVSDSDTYWCQARRGPAQLKLNFSNALTLKVQERPRAEITSVQGWSDVFRNEKLILQCTGDKKYNNWRYRWYKNGEELQEGQGNGVAKGNTWAIDLINESHGGTYVCKGERSSRPTYTQRSKPFNVTVREKPPNTALILKPQQTPIFEGDMVTLSCEVDDSPAAGWRFWWFTNSNKSSIPTICKNGSQESKCTIQSVTLSYTAEYWCQAGRGEPPFYLNSSRPVVLQVHVAFDEPVLLLLTQWSVWIGEPISLHCKTQLKNMALRGHLQYRFYRNGTVWTQPGSQDTLTISSAEISDTGLYSCEVEATGTNVKKQSGTINVRVTDRPKLFLTMRPSWQVVYYGETVTLYCQMNIDIPGLQYQWYKDGERLQAPYAVGHKLESNICTISAIVWSDQGEYKCQAHTGKPSVQLYTSRPLLLNITEHPEVSFLQWPTWTVLFAGDTVTLNCRVNGNPLFKKFWWFMATANHLRQNLSCENIPSCSVTFSDKNQSGLYWCETEWGEKRSKAVSFTVTADMVALQTPPLPLTEGDNVTLECRTQYLTSYTTKVYHEDQERQPSVWYTRVKKEHEGRYKCVVFSGETLKASSEEVNITVRDFFSSVMLTSVQGLSVKKGEMVKLTCEVKNNSLQKLPVHYSFLKDGMVLSEGENITYTIMKMNESHAGNYTCVASIEHDIRKESVLQKICIAKPWWPMVAFAGGSVLVVLLIFLVSVWCVKRYKASEKLEVEETTYAIIEGLKTTKEETSPAGNEATNSVGQQLQNQDASVSAGNGGLYSVISRKRKTGFSQKMNVEPAYALINLMRRKRDRSSESGDADPNSPPYLNERRGQPAVAGAEIVYSTVSGNTSGVSGSSNDYYTEIDLQPHGSAAIKTSPFHKVRHNSRMSKRKKSLRRTMSEHHYEEI
ncbi:basement membrane-specific heparan sulfate proteoglycan core protein-like [Erpetoichthys calabaricus]|uniref:basement membrane-specific heparan sulfate proteoglycan core protein-like n=1 Tax=Erpetoichthys calabaricus TaxID=27687 RepID=UPI0022342A83|nr:basement membrane-specific heparan sulfate proteoglycan core protein-like [Erpetoichthys calabaricus]